MNDEKITVKTLLKIMIIGILLYCGVEHFTKVLNLFSFLFQLIFPFVLGSAIAFIVNVPMRFVERHFFPNTRALHKSRRGLSYLITLIFILGILSLAMFIIIPEIGNTVKIIAWEIPYAFDHFQNWLMKVTKDLPNAETIFNELNLDWGSISTKAASIIRTAGTSILSSGFGLVSGIVGGVATFVIAFTFSVYLLLQKEKIGSQFKQALYAILPEKAADRIIYIGQLSNRTFSNFLSGQCIEAVILGTMFFITLSIFRLPYAMLIGVVISITALIPIFGAFIGCAIGVFLIVMVNPIKAIWFIIIFVVLQQIEGNLIYPHVVGGSIGLPSIWVLVAVTIGGNLLGIAGILLFIPLCSVCYALFREYVKKQLQNKNISTDKWKVIKPEKTLTQNSSHKKTDSTKNKSTKQAAK